MIDAAPQLTLNSSCFFPQLVSVQVQLSMAALPQSIPALPQHEDNHIWSANVQRAHTLLDRGYRQALQVILEGENDAHRHHLHAEKLVRRIFPILEALERDGMNVLWIREVGEMLAALVIALEYRAEAVDNVYVHHSLLMLSNRGCAWHMISFSHWLTCSAVSLHAFSAQS